MGLSGHLLATMAVILLHLHLCQSHYGTKTEFESPTSSSALAHGVGVSRALPGESEKIRGGCMVLLRLLKYPRSGGISGLFSLAASPKSPQGMEGNLSSMEPKTWAGQLGRKWREWGRRLLFRDEANFQIWPWNLLI